MEGYKACIRFPKEERFDLTSKVRWTSLFVSFNM
ncbi:MAG: hypothetical protein GY849_06615 [Deltaproteobacteria bacterium]|nr:hypothetical protein [Deltaproteobacteria bacterium]